MENCNLDANLTKEDRTLKESAHKFAETVMRPISVQLDKMSAEEVIAPGSPFWDFMRKAYSLGYHKLPFPEVVGGPGLTPFQISLAMEELAWGSFGMTLALNTSLDAAVAVEGGEEFIKNFTIPYCRCTDASYIGAWAITEPDHGSDTLMAGYPTFSDPKIKAQCRARLEGDEYVINGQKAAWASGGTIAKTILLMAQVDPSKGHTGSGVFVFSLDRPGVSRGKPLEKIGTRELNQGEIYFDDVRVPKKAMLIGPDRYEAALAAHLSMTTPMHGRGNREENCSSITSSCSRNFLICSARSRLPGSSAAQPSCITGPSRRKNASPSTLLRPRLSRRRPLSTSPATPFRYSGETGSRKNISSKSSTEMRERPLFAMDRTIASPSSAGSALLSTILAKPAGEKAGPGNAGWYPRGKKSPGAGSGEAGL